jgi:hypothetical protein
VVPWLEMAHAQVGRWNQIATTDFDAIVEHLCQGSSALVLPRLSGVRVRRIACLRGLTAVLLPAPGPRPDPTAEGPPAAVQDPRQASPTPSHACPSQLPLHPDGGCWVNYSPKVHSPPPYRAYSPTLSLSLLSSARFCPRGCRYIVVLRDPEDTALSLFHFIQGWFFQPGEISVQDFVR